MDIRLSGVYGSATGDGKPVCWYILFQKCKTLRSVTGDKTRHRDSAEGYANAGVAERKAKRYSTVQEPCIAVHVDDLKRYGTFN